MNKYIKKIVITDEQATPLARAQRLKRVRNLANLTRQQMCQDEININTYKGWELAKYGGLPQDGAEKVIQRLQKENVICTLDWLLYGTGITPRVLFYNNLVDQDDLNLELKSIDHEDYLILEEIELFRQHYPQVLYCRISDDGMLPFYHIGDYVAGSQVELNESVISQWNDFIVVTDSKKTCVRQVRKEKNGNGYRLLCRNIETSQVTPILYNVNIQLLAPVLRVYNKINKPK